MFIVFGASALVVSRDTGRDTASEPSTPSTTAAPVDSSQTETPAAVSAAAVTDITHLVTSITTSSELSTEYGADRLIDGDLERSWQDASLQGVGAWFEIHFNDPVAIEKIVVTPLSEEAGFARNFNVDTYTIEVNDGVTLVTGRLANDASPQAITIGSTNTLALRFTVDSTYPAMADGDGPPFDELAIAEIQVFGTPLDKPAPAVVGNEVPRFGTVSNNWSVIEAIDTGIGTTLIYEGDPMVYGRGGEAGDPRLSIEIWSDTPGQDGSNGYEHALASVSTREDSLADVTFGDGTTAKSFTFTDPNTGNSGYYFLRDYSDTVAVEVIVYIDSFDEAAAVVSSIQRLSEFDWELILASQPSDNTVTTTTLTPTGEEETEAVAFRSPDIDIQEQPDYWDALIANATSSDGASVELRGQLLNVYNEVLNGVGGLPLEYLAGRYDPGVYEAATFLYRSGGSTVLLAVQWQEWDGRSESNPLGFPATSVREQWGGDSVFIDITPDLGAFGGVNTGSLKTVRFTPLTTATEGTLPFTISEAEMQEIAQAVFKTLTP